MASLLLLNSRPLLFSYEPQALASVRQKLQEELQKNSPKNTPLWPDKRRALFLAEKMRPDFVYHTIALEGNPFTFPEVKTLLDGITVGGHKVSDEKQVLNFDSALSYVLDLVRKNQFQINQKTACAIQGLVAREEALTWGEFRDGMVGEVFECGSQALGQIEDPVLRAFLTFLWGSINQFFYDGNKRTSRFLANGTFTERRLAAADNSSQRSADL